MKSGAWSRRGFAAITFVLLALTLVLLDGVATAAFQAEPVPAATVTVFVGTASILRAGAGAAVSARSGDVVRSNDTVATGAASKAGITYPDGSVTRLDSNTEVRISLARLRTGAVDTGVDQSSGLTWNRVKRLVGGAHFKVDGPNNASAQVRGTIFGFYVEHDAAGNPVIWIDTYEGLVAITGATGPGVVAPANTRVTVRANSAPTTPAPIPPADRQLSFTVFNQAFDAITGEAFQFQQGAGTPGQTSIAYPVAADGVSDLELVLNWPGSTFALTVTDPDGNLYAQPAGSRPPLRVVVPRAKQGTWLFRVVDVQSAPQEAWWVIAARS